MKVSLRTALLPLLAVVVSLGGLLAVATPALAASPVRHVDIQFNIDLNAQPGQNDLSQITVCSSRHYTHSRACSYKRYGYIRPNINGTLTPIRRAHEKLQPKYSYTVYWSTNRVVNRVYKGGSPSEHYYSRYYHADLYLETLHVNYSYK